MLPGLTAFVKLSSGPMSGLGAAFLVQNVGNKELYLLGISNTCVLFMEGFFP